LPRRLGYASGYSFHLINLSHVQVRTIYIKNGAAYRDVSDYRRVAVILPRVKSGAWAAYRLLRTSGGMTLCPTSR